MSSEEATAIPRGITVRELERRGDARWDNFVEAHADATFFHLSGWRSVIERAFGHRTHYLYAESDGHLLGVLPLVHVRSLLFGNALVSTPFCVYGGPVPSDGPACKELLSVAETLASDLGVDYLELRNSAPVADWPTKNTYVTFRRTLLPTAEENLQAIPRKQRAIVRKGIKSDLRSTWNEDPSAVYDIYAASLKNLGTPVFARKYLVALSEAFADKCRTLDVFLGEQRVASVMSFFFRREVLPYYGGGISQARSVHANDFMYWELMRRSLDERILAFDFGRSKVDSGSYRFKKHWGFEPAPLFYQYKLLKSHSLPDVSPNNPRYRLAISAWRKLPLWITQLLGPPLARYLG